MLLFIHDHLIILGNALVSITWSSFNSTYIARILYNSYDTSRLTQITVYFIYVNVLSIPKEMCRYINCRSHAEGRHHVDMNFFPLLASLAVPSCLWIRNLRHRIYEYICHLNFGMVTIRLFDPLFTSPTPGFCLILFTISLKAVGRHFLRG